MPFWNYIHQKPDIKGVKHNEGFIFAVVRLGAAPAFFWVLGQLISQTVGLYSNHNFTFLP